MSDHGLNLRIARLERKRGAARDRRKVFLDVWHSGDSADDEEYLARVFSVMTPEQREQAEHDLEAALRTEANPMMLANRL